MKETALKIAALTALMPLSAPGAWADAPWKHLATDVACHYNWGTYATNGQADNTHAGVGLQLLLAYRHRSGLEAGLSAAFAFPQVTVPDSANDAAFSYHSFGLQVGYLVRGILEPFVQYSPFAQLAQTTKSRLGASTVSTDLSYHGHSFGTGMKIYLTPRDVKTAQVGLRFMFTRESYGNVRMSSSIESNTDHAAAAYTSAPVGPAQEQSVTGNTYSLGFFVGI